MKKVTIENVYFGTRPFAFHFHGDCRHSNNNQYFAPLFMETGQIWPLLLDGQDAEGVYYCHKHRERPFPILPKGTTHPVNDELHTFTISNLKELGVGARTMDYFGIEYDVVGKDMPKPYIHNMKIHELLKYIPTIEKPYTMFFDSSDIVFTAPPDSLLADFKHRPESMLCNADGWSYPLKSPTLEWEEHTAESRSPKSPYRYLNSGLWIACTKFLKEKFHPLMEKYSNKWDEWDLLRTTEPSKSTKEAWDIHLASGGPYSDVDQGIFKHIYQDLYPEVVVDHSCRYFQSMAWSPWFEDRYLGGNELKLIGSEEI